MKRLSERIITKVDRHFLVASLILATATVAGLVLWSEKYGGKVVLMELLQGNRSAVYGALASMFGSLLGFVIAAVSIAVGFSGSERLDIVRNSKHYPELWNAFNHAIRALGLATLVALAALILDRDSKPFCLLSYAATWVTLLAALLLGRSVWVLEQLVAVVAAQRNPNAEKK